MLNKFRHALETLRAAPEAVRRRWLYAFTTTATLIIIGLWIGYLDVTVRPGAPSTDIKTSTTQQAPTDISNTFSAGLETITRGATTFGNKLTTYLTSIIGSSHTIAVKRPRLIFTSNTVPTVPPQPLPISTPQQQP